MDETNKFEGMFFAFNDEQFSEGMKKVGATSKKEIFSIGYGGFILKTQNKAFSEMLNKHDEEMKTLQADEKELIDAIAYELSNHEYCITGNPQDALDALGLDEVDPKILRKAIIKHNK